MDPNGPNSILVVRVAFLNWSAATRRYLPSVAPSYCDEACVRVRAVAGLWTPMQSTPLMYRGRRAVSKS